MAIVTVSEKGQMVIPANIRRSLAISAGTRLEIVADPQGFRVVVEPFRKTKSASDCLGIANYGGPKIDLDKFDVAILAKKP